MTNDELISICGGASINSTLINTLLRFSSFSLELGRTLGTLIRRAIDKKVCK